MYPLGNIINSEWQRATTLDDYRTEELSNIVVERATWLENAPICEIAKTVIAKPGYVWLRFWLLEEELLIEKYYNSVGEPIGYYVPISMPVKQRNNQLEAYSLLLALWLDAEDRVTVLHEEQFETAVSNGEITPVEAEHAEMRIRELTTSLSRKQFPPPLVRNFEIDL